nr:hypothetical protein [Tanacetum cinerariifolium]
EAVYKELDDRLGRKIDDINVDENITLVNDQDDAEMFDVNDLQGEEVFVEIEVADKELQLKVTLAKALEELKASKPKVKQVFIQEPSESITKTTISSKKSQHKGKAIMTKEPIKRKKKEQIRLDEEAGLKLQDELQAQFD